MKIPPVGHALSVFLVTSYTLCVLWCLATPASLHMYPAWAPLMPGFHWLSLPSFLIGLVWAYVYGWYAALVFVPLYNLFSKRAAAA